MSRIGKKPIILPPGVTVEIKDGCICVKGQKGTLKKPLLDSISMEIKENTVALAIKSQKTKVTSAFHGLMRALTQNMVTGVHQGFERKLEINGVGYRAEVQGNKILLQLGYSHPIDYPLPEGVSAKVDKNILTLSSIDKELLGHVASKIRAKRPPEPYKGKGIRYLHEVVQRKAGKAGSA